LLALFDKLRDELTHPFVAPMENGRIVIVSNPRIIHHELEITNDLGSGEVLSPGRNERLMHVQSDRKSAIDAAKIDAALGQKDRFVSMLADGGVNQWFGSTKVGTIFNVFRQRIHKRISSNEA
jgi:hypothetical protein